MSFNPGNISKADATAYSSSDSEDGEDDHLDHVSGDPRSDYLDDFKPRKRRRINGDAKERAALGVFGSDSEDDGPGRRWKAKKDLRHKNMSFVSAGRQTANRGVDEDEDEDEEMEDDIDDEYAEPSRFGLGSKAAAVAEQQDEEYDDEEEAAATGIGLGFRSAAQGLGWATPTQAAAPTASPMSNTAQSMSTKQPKFSGSTPLGQGFVPSSANEPVLKPGLSDVPGPATKPKPSAFSGRGGAKMSFGQRMMAKMGYVEGKGLGAEEQGRNVIIEANLRPQGAGLGAVREKSKQEREEEKRQAKIRGEEVLDSEEEEKEKRRKLRDRKKKNGLESGTASGGSTPRRPKTKYLTVNDMQKAAPGLHIPDAFAPILDLTGPGQKLLTPGSGLMTPTAGTEVVEQTEARKLASRAQRDLNAFVEEWKTLEERKAWLDMENHQRQQGLDELQGMLEAMQLVAALLDTISIAAAEKQWDPVISGLKQIEAATAVDGIDDVDLAGVAVAAIHPFLRDAIQGWHPLEDTKLGNFADDLAAIQGVLGLKKKPASAAVTRWDDQDIESTHRQHQKSTTPYESMVYKILFPKLVTTITQQWDVFDAAPLLAVFDKWEPLFPSFIRNQLIEQLVRRLNDAIGAWKPRKKQHNLPHLWLFPWLQHLPPYHLEPKGTGIVAEVRRKFRQLVDIWEFDRGVIPGLKEWKEVLRPSKSQDQWKPLIMHHVLPSMAKYLRVNFRVDPSDQEPYLPILNGVLKWAGIIAPSMVGEVVVVEVFPMWHDVLHQWLTSEEANYEEIGAWFEWWKDTALADLVEVESVTAEFNRGAKMIETALELGTNAKNLPRPNRRPALQAKPQPKPQISPVVTAVPPNPIQKSFREEVEDWCNEDDVRFIPVHNRTTNAGQKYYRLTARMDGKGGVLAYFDKAGDEEVLVADGRKTKFIVKRGEAGAEWQSLLGALYQEVS
ncbi:tuftelin interacting protein 11 [Seiridium cupressi]